MTHLQESKEILFKKRIAKIVLTIDAGVISTEIDTCFQYSNDKIYIGILLKLGHRF